MARPVLSLAHGTEFAQLHRVLARVQQELAALRQADERLRTQQAITRALAESSSVAEAAPGIFEALCTTLTYDWGELWRVEPALNRLRCTQTWPAPPNFAEMEQAARQATFSRNEGIPGTVWTRNKPLWISDLARHPGYQRAAAARPYGLRTVFAFPIRLNHEVLGVITVYSRQTSPPDKHLLRLFRDICSQIGQVMGRRRAERRLLDISEREQQRIGQDLHDGLCQQLTGIAYMASNLQTKLVTAAAPDAAIAGRIAEISRDTATQARQLARGLNPVKLDTGGLNAALDALAGSIQTMFSITCRFECRHRIVVADHETAIHLYRITQEAIHNAITHGKATTITIDLRRRAGRLELRVADNGRGLARTGAAGAGIGLENMHYRARAVGAHLAVRSRPAGGTVMACQLPPDHGATS